MQNIGVNAWFYGCDINRECVVIFNFLLNIIWHILCNNEVLSKGIGR